MEPLTFATEEDVVALFRQAIQRQLLHIQNGHARQKHVVVEPTTPKEGLQHLAERCDEPEREVALLRTIKLRLVSEPVHRHNGAPA